MKRDQKGFGAVEGLLILIIVGLVGFIGYYVYHSKNTTNSIYNNVANSSTSPVTSSSNTKFVFKELGVQFNLPAELKGMTYSMHSTTPCGESAICPVYTELKHPDFTEANNKCYGQNSASAEAAFATIGGNGGTFNQDQNPTVGLLKQFSGSYLTISYPNGITYGCSTGIDGGTVQNEAHKLQTAFVTAFQKTATQVK